jgi:hypothetical protein
MDAEIRQPSIYTLLQSARNRKIYLVFAAALILGALLAALDGTGRWLNGWVSYSILSAAALSLVLAAGRLTGASRVRKAAWTAFILRLAVGVFLFLIFPAAGYPDNRATQAGYTFDDAYVRDQQAWRLGVSDTPLVTAFTGTYEGDQYGGMLAMSAAVYRYLSPEAHRPFLILILGAAAAACGVLFLWKAAEAWFGTVVAGTAAWIFALYPEAVVLGSSHMREPFIISAIALAFLGLVRAREKGLAGPAALLISAAVLLILQPPVALAVFLLIGGLWFLDHRREISLKHAVLILMIVILAVVMVTSVWANLPSMQEGEYSNVFLAWLQNNFTFQSKMTERGSGMVQHIFRTIGDQWRLPFILAYGAMRPVLPAALADKAEVALIWRIINIFRAAGWYALALLLIYQLFCILRNVAKERRSQLVWLSVFVWFWIFLAAANAGADQWDNPRYRTVMIPWFAVLAGLALYWARLRRDPWLARWFWVMTVFTAFFTIWYLGRNYIFAISMDIWVVTALSFVSAIMILGGGWAKDNGYLKLGRKAG